MKICSLSILCLIFSASAFAQQPSSAAWDSVGRILGTAPANAAGYMRYNLPRRDLTVRIGDVTVSPSLALGACLVASAVGELPEVLSQGAGLLVPPGDAAALGAALGQLRAAEARAGIAERAVQRSRSYDVAAMAGAYASLYARALSLEPIPSSSR